MVQGHDQPFGQPQIRIYQLQGTSQFVVTMGKDEYSFLSEADARRFAERWAPSTASVLTKEVPVGQNWDKWSSTPSVPPIREL